MKSLVFIAALSSFNSHGFLLSSPIFPRRFKSGKSATFTTLRRDVSSSATCAALASQTVQTKDEIAKFTSEPMKVYIEDTDAYGVIYNGNYLRFYERALHQVSCSNKKCSEERNISSNGVLNHPGWYLTYLTAHKFKSSPSLGEEFVICGEKVQCSQFEENDNGNDNPAIEEWNLKMIKNPSESGSKEVKEIIYNTATVRVMTPPSSFCESFTKEQTTSPPFLCSKENSKTFENIFTTYRDEFDAHMTVVNKENDANGTLQGHIPLRNILNFFERSRTSALGGPNTLRQMKEEDGILFVVTSIDDLELINIWNKTDEDSIDNNDGSLGDSNVYCQPGDDVIVKSEVEIKRRGMILECRQTLLSQRSDGKMRRLAQGVVTICAIDRDTFRPTAKIPSYVRDLFSN